MTSPATASGGTSIIEAVVDAVKRRPGITVSELAGDLGIAANMLATLRDALDRVIDDRPAADDPPRAERWGPTPSPGALASARTTGEIVRREALAVVLDGALTRDQAAERLGVTTQAVSERLKTGSLTAVRRGREWRFPDWQFTDDAALPGLKQLIAAWPGTPLSLSVWALKPSPDLHGHSPAHELARRDGTTTVLQLVEAIGAAGW